MQGLPIELRVEAFSTRNGNRKALLCRPTEPIRLDIAELRAVNDSGESSEIDRAIIAAARAESPDVFLFQGGENTDAQWRLSDTVHQEDLALAGELVVRSHLWLYGQLGVAGAGLIVGVEMGLRELDAFRLGTEAVLDAIERRSLAGGGLTPVEELNDWMLRHLTFFTSLPASRVLESLVPAELPLLERRLPRFRDLLASAYKA